MVTAGNDGTATITVINGPAEKVVPVMVEDPSVGPTSLGAQGGVVEGTDGSMVMIAPGSLTGNATMSVAPVSQASLPMPAPSIVSFLGAINLDFGGQTLAHPVQLVVPAPAGTKVGAKVYFYRADHHSRCHRQAPAVLGRVGSRHGHGRRFRAYDLQE